MPTNNHTKQILLGNFKTQSHILCTAFFCSQVSKTTWNVLNCYVNLTNRFHVAVRLFSSRSQLTTVWLEQKSDDQNHAALTSQSLRAAIGPLQFSLRHWNFRNLTLQITRNFFRLHSTFARLYNAAASPASRLRSAVSLAIIVLDWRNICYESRKKDTKTSTKRHEWNGMTQNGLFYILSNAHA